MVHSFDGYNYLIRLDKGERWSDALKQFTREVSVDGAWLSAIGGVLEVTLGFYDIDKKEYQWQTFQGLREMTGIQGNLAVNEASEVVAHLHGSFSDENYQVIGGHVKDFVAAATVEVFVHRAYKPMRRTMDEAVGLPTLDLSADEA